VQPPASLGNQDSMAKNLSYKELLSNLNGLTVRNVVAAELVGSLKRRDQVARSALIVA
jgi:hypothetical protein